MNPGILDEMTIEDVRAFNTEVVVWAIASTEPHGPVLPYGTDHLQCDAAVRAGVILANQRGARALQYPTMPIGCNANFKGFPFACRIAPQTLIQVVLDVIEALEEDGIRKIVLVDGHGGNTEMMRAALRAHAHRHRPGDGSAFVCITRGSAPQGLIAHPSDHGGESEVSRMLHVRPDLVHKEKFGVFPWGELAVEALKDPHVIFVRPWHLYVPAAAGGDVREATEEKGRKLIEHSAEYLANLLVELTKAKFTDTFPYKPRG
jgi:creatinine amidohydrolase